MKKLLMLGANEKQVQLIKAAKDEGYYVIVCGNNDSHPGIPLADKVYTVSYTDQEAVLSVAKLEQIDGVIGNNDPAMPIVAYVSEQLGLVGNTKSSIDSIVSKSQFREIQEKSRVFCPKHFEADDFAEVAESIQDFNDPIVIKPSLCAGSQGTTKTFKNQLEIIRNAFEICKDYSRDGKVTIEEYVEMPTLDVIEGDIFVMGDDILWNGIFTTGRSKNVPMIPMTYIFPAILTDEQLDAIKISVTKVLREAGIRHGQYNVEMYFTETGELFIIEVNPRQGGHLIPQWIMEHTGIDYSKLLVTTALGDNSYFNAVRSVDPTNSFHTHHVVFSDVGGVLDEVVIDPVIGKYVTEVQLLIQKGDYVNPITIARNRTIGYVSLKFPDRQTQIAYNPDLLRAMINPVVRPEEKD